MRKIMSLDMSTKSTGIAIFEGKEYKKHYLIESHKNNLLDRITDMVTAIEQIYNENENIEEIFVEDVLPEDVGNNLNTFKGLHYLQAAVALMFHKYHKKINLVGASTWRRECGIRGGRGIKRDALKQASMDLVKEKYNLIVNDDIADAICLGYASSKKMGAF